MGKGRKFPTDLLPVFATCRLTSRRPDGCEPRPVCSHRLLGLGAVVRAGLWSYFARAQRTCHARPMAMHLKWICGQGTVVAAAIRPCASRYPAVRSPPRAVEATIYRERTAISPPRSPRLRAATCATTSSTMTRASDARPINGGLDPGFDQKLWMDRLTFGGFAERTLFGGRFGLEVQIPYVFDLTVAQRPRRTGLRFFRIAARPGHGRSGVQAAARVGLRVRTTPSCRSASWRPWARTMTTGWSRSAVTTGRLIRRSPTPI